MSFAFLILIFAAVLIILAFSVALRVKLVFDSYEKGINMTCSWLSSFLKASIVMTDGLPLLTVYLFNKEVYRKKVRSKGQNTDRMQLLKLAEPKDVHINTSFGFRDPFITGIACGAINVASQFINIESINQNPDFTAENDYIYMDATAKVNPGTTILNMLKAKK